MWTDPIVEEIRREREAYAAKFNFDINAICQDIVRQQQESGREFVTLPSKRRVTESEAIDAFQKEEETMSITLKPETEALLRERAARDGVDISAIADEIILAGLEWEARDREEAAESLRLSLAQSDAGQVRRFSEVAEEWRVKYNLPTHLSDAEILAGETSAGMQ